MTTDSFEFGRTRNDLIQGFQATLDERVERYIEVHHQRVIPGQHFAAASAECLTIYTDGHFIGTVMMAQAVAEGISKFVATRNNIQFNPKQMFKEQDVRALVEKGIVTKEYQDAFNRLWDRRNDVHHMDPMVGTINFRELAKKCIQDLTVIEHEVFDANFVNGAIQPVQPRYWDIAEGGTTTVFLRCSP